MGILFISIIAFIGSTLTFFSGFGLGTLLLPVFILFFPVSVAIGLTAIVHFLNNLYKLVLVGHTADRKTIIKFSLPAIPAAFLGSFLLTEMSLIEPIYTYTIFHHNFKIEYVKLGVAILMMLFSLLEIHPKLSQLTVDKKYLSLGGMLSGFFGGLSGHQGALRSVFLIRVGLSKEAFIGTGVVTASLVDVTRLIVYGVKFSEFNFLQNKTILIVAVSSAFIGAFFGNKLLKKVTLKSIRYLVSILLFIIAILLGAGVI